MRPPKFGPIFVLLVLANFSADELAVTGEQVPGLEDWSGADLVLGNFAQEPDSVVAPLRAWEARILRRTT